MRRTFNLGVGYVFVVAEDQAAAARAVLAAEGDVAIRARARRRGPGGQAVRGARGVALVAG